MAKTRSAFYTRTRLLNQLGLFQEPLPKISAAVTTSPSSLAATTTSATKPSGIDGSCTSFSDSHHPSSHVSMAPFEMTLNDASWPEDEHETNTGRSSCHSSMDTKSMESCEKQNQQPHQQHRHVHFKDTVSVLPIPSRYQYSERIKQQIWSNRIELREMAQRNMMEFEAEGFDWRNVVLENDMYIDAGNGTYVHPCHVQQARRYPQITSMRIATPDGKGGTITRSLQEVLGNHDDIDDDDDEEAEDDRFQFAPLRKFDSIVMA